MSLIFLLRWMILTIKLGGWIFKVLRIRIVICSLVVCVFWSTITLATDYYVSPTGTETWPNCTAQSNPCRASNTDKAFLGAAAGDTVYFLDGEYSGLTVPYAIYIKTPVWYASNSGTAENPITFKALNRRQVILEGLGNATKPISNEIIPLIGCQEGSGDNYVVWDGFVLKAVRSDGTTPAMARASMYACNHVTVNDCEIIGVEHSNGGAENWDGVRFEGSDHITVTNCDIHGFKETSHNHNTSALKTYSSYYAKIHHNNFYDNYTHIYIKGSGNGNFDIGYNSFYSGDGGILNPANSGNEPNHTYHNNLFVNIKESITDGGGSGYVQNDLIIRNNTFFNTVGGLLFVTQTWIDAG
ncbi:MAG: hypothetical protein D3910_06745, partial [Candidatus Electrothrix sp. ATG2]|nr:hypothetical protein [Candidatus Electrothrix sp. ATG2]